MKFEAFKFAIRAANSLNESFISKRCAQIVTHVRSNSSALRVFGLSWVIRFRERASIFQRNAFNLRKREKYEKNKVW